MRQRANQTERVVDLSSCLGGIADEMGIRVWINARRKEPLSVLFRLASWGLRCLARLNQERHSENRLTLKLIYVQVDWWLIYYDVPGCQPCQAPSPAQKTRLQFITFTPASHREPACSFLFLSRHQQTGLSRRQLPISSQGASAPSQHVEALVSSQSALSTSPRPR